MHVTLHPLHMYPHQLQMLEFVDDWVRSKVHVQPSVWVPVAEEQQQQ